MTSCNVSREGELTRSLSPSMVTLHLSFWALMSLLILPAVSLSMPLTTVAHRRTPPPEEGVESPHFTAVRSMPRLMSLLPMTSMTWEATNSAGAVTVRVPALLSREISAPESFRS